MTKSVSIILVGLALASGVGRAQEYAYDVVTIKPNTTGSGSTSTSMEDSSFKASNVPLKRLLVRAYGVRAELIAGLPEWAETERFDVNAKVVDADPEVYKKLTAEQRRGFIVALLRDRFHLQVHIEMKTLPVYELVLNGEPKFREHPGVVAGSGDMGSGSDDGQAKVTGTGVAMSSLAEVLTSQTDRTVIDRTGLKGRYDLELKWTLDRAASAPDNGSTEEERPGLFTALKEQLGLKLQPGKGPVATLVVDRVERPTEN